jgi:Apea-like HEPN
VIIDAYNHFDSLPSDLRNRVALSLRWFYSSFLAEGVDIFLKSWFALEALGMGDRENINPLNECLAKAYGISVQKARQMFGVGKLFGLRSSIVHQGQILPIHANLSDYVEALYIDVLLERLNLPCERRAESILRGSDFDLSKLTDSK